jgi:CheY-like chemotaxis protein
MALLIEAGQMTASDYVPIYPDLPLASEGASTEGHYVRLSVRDTGNGMDEETLSRAVEPFFSTKGIGKGTGLGLSMVHGLTAQLGGGLTVESAPGQGTAVTLWLPISAAPIQDQDPVRHSVETRVRRGVALLVDDEDLVRMSTSDMLSDFGFEVIEVGSGEEALALLQSGTMPDILVTDHLMPGISGTELAHRAQRMIPQLPVLVVSGYADVEGIAPDLPRLTKPFRSSELSQSINALLPEAAI